MKGTTLGIDLAKIYEISRRKKSEPDFKSSSLKKS